MTFEELDNSIGTTYLAYNYILRLWDEAKKAYLENDDYSVIEEFTNMLRETNPAVTYKQSLVQVDILATLDEIVLDGHSVKVVFTDDVTKFKGVLTVNGEAVTVYQQVVIREENPTIQIKLTDPDYLNTPLQTISNVTLTNEDGEPVTKTGTFLDLSVAAYPHRQLIVKYTIADKLGITKLATVDAGFSKAELTSARNANVTMVVGTDYSDLINTNGTVKFTPKANYKFNSITLGGVAQTITAEGVQNINVKFDGKVLAAVTGLIQRNARVTIMDANTQSVVLTSPKHAGVTMVTGTNYADDITATGKIRVTPKAGYTLRAVKIGGINQQLSTTNGYQDFNVSFATNFDITVETELITYLVTFNIGDGTKYATKTYKINTDAANTIGSNVNVAQGSVIEYRFVPIADYKITAASYDGTAETITDDQLVVFTKTLTKNVTVQVTVAPVA